MDVTCAIAASSDNFSSLRLNAAYRVRLALPCGWVTATSLNPAINSKFSSASFPHASCVCICFAYNTVTSVLWCTIDGCPSQMPTCSTSYPEPEEIQGSVSKQSETARRAAGHATIALDFTRLGKALSQGLMKPA